MPTPQERGFFGSLNTIKVLTESTCADKWEILIETAFPAAGEALWMLLIPSPGEILENYLQPQPARSGGKRGNRDHGRRLNTRFGGRRWWQRLGFPDVDAIVAEKLPGRDLFKGRSAGGLEKWMWTGIDVLDRGLWYWLLLDASETFVVEWASGIMESRFCTSPLDALLIARGNQTPNDNSGPVWGQQSQVIVDSNAGWFISTSGQVSRENPFVPVGGPVIYTVTGTRPEDDRDRPSTFQLLMEAVHPDAPGTIYLSAEKNIKRGETVTLQINGNVSNCIGLRFSMRLTGASFIVPLENPSWDVAVFCKPEP